jgi:hypothetical protein
LKIAAFTFVVITESSTYCPVPSRDRVAPHPQIEASNKKVRSEIFDQRSTGFRLGLLAAPAPWGS